MGPEMDIDGSGSNCFVAHEFFNREKVDAIFIEMGAEGMPERMAGKTLRPAETGFMSGDVSEKEVGIDRFIRTTLFVEEIIHRSAAFKPVLRKDIEGSSRENGVTVRTVFGMLDVNAHALTFYILVLQKTAFAAAKTGGI